MNNAIITGLSEKEQSLVIDGFTKGKTPYQICVDSGMTNKVQQVQNFIANSANDQIGLNVSLNLSRSLTIGRDIAETVYEKYKNGDELTKFEESALLQFTSQSGNAQKLIIDTMQRKKTQRGAIKVGKPSLQ